MKKVDLPIQEYHSPDVMLIDAHAEQILCLSGTGATTEGLTEDEDYVYAG